MKLKKDILLTLVFIFLFKCGYTQKSELKTIQDILQSDLSDSLKLSKFLEINSKLYSDSGFKALDNFNRASEYFKNNKTFSIQIIKNKSVLLKQMGNYKEAIAVLLDGINICDKRTENLKNQLFINISGNYETTKDFKKSKLYLDSALEYFLETNDLKTASLCYNNKGNLENEQGNYRLALAFHFKAKKIREQGPIGINLAQTYLNIGETYSNYNMADSALFYTKKSLNICDSLNIEIGKGFCYGVLAQIMLLKKDYFKAEDFALKKLEVSKKLNITDMKLSSFAILYETNKTIKNYEKALDFRNKYINLKDSLFNLENAKKLFAIEYDNQIKIQKKQEEQKELIRKKENEKKGYLLKFSATFILVLILAFFYLLKINNDKRKRNKIIEKQKAEVENQKAIIEEHQKEILDSIHYAKRIQNALLANREHVKAHLSDSFIYFNPKDIVSGDFYWATNHINSQGVECFYLAVCDSTGHGVPGAFMSLLNIGFLSEAIKEKNIELPNEVFSYVRQRLIGSISGEGQKDGFDGILLRFNCSELSGKSEKLNIIYAASNNEPILVKNETYVELPKDKMPVGKGERTDDFNLYSLDLLKGEALYLYTDGYADQFGGNKAKKFKYKQLNELLRNINEEPMHRQEQILSETFNNWRGNIEQIDDVCVIGFRI